MVYIRLSEGTLALLDQLNTKQKEHLNKHTENTGCIKFAEFDNAIKNTDPLVRDRIAASVKNCDFVFTIDHQNELKVPLLSYSDCKQA